MLEQDVSEHAFSHVITQYLSQSGLAQHYRDIAPMVSRELALLQQALTGAAAVTVNWQYRVPELGEGGACSLFGVLDPEPYDLRPILGGDSAETQAALQQLQVVTQYYQQRSGLDWFGIYQARPNTTGQDVLVKLAYYGAPSRAEFPLNADFAQISNNSSVGLSGKARVINDVSAYLAQGGEYYTCDPKVQAEACLPLLTQSGKIVGIIDAEDFRKNVFTADAMALLVAVCVTLPALLPVVAARP